MKKLLLLLAAIVLVIIALSTLGPLIGLAFALALVFLGMHYYIKSRSVAGKMLWILIGLIGLVMAVSNVPALLGLAAIVLLYVLYQKWKGEEVSFSGKEQDDPFTNFENEWSKLQSKERF
ncbi:lmo0954 family membrane protein [Ureibacillus terrenus]|uniref:ABC transporter permease n=2 Tax=Bacillati TaxID=1783272 RepID=A0A540V6S0_9BACL|nr:ABC transporter permease [Ureibacillus terrenus]MED3660563.1 ABC transporter permease [Ureibacillus terrenus]MED3762683.1 ABC transporter permease [Ureibacillus terrenus]TQE92442.1 ABC transporter permease [Ureibacillus terrenus]